MALEAFLAHWGVAAVFVGAMAEGETFVIGGGASAVWDLFIQHVEDQIRSRACHEPGVRARLERAVLGDDAGILGAARIAFD